MFEIRQPSFGPKGDRSPRRRSQGYYYDYDNQPEIQDIIIAIVNGISIEHIDPKLYVSLYRPLVETFNELRMTKNRAAINNVSKSLDFVQKLIELPQKSDTCQVTLENIIYCNGAITKLMEALMNGKELPTLPPKLYSILEQNLKDMLNTENSSVDPRIVKQGLFTLTKDPKYQPPKIVEEPIKNNDIKQKGKIELINQRLKAQLQKNENELKAELETLKANYNAQMRLVEFNKENLYTNEAAIVSPELNDLKSKELYFKSIHSNKKAEMIHHRINNIIESAKTETRRKIETEINIQRKNIQENYDSKCRIKVNHYKYLAKILKQNAQKEIDKLTGENCIKSAPTLPLLSGRRKSLN